MSLEEWESKYAANQVENVKRITSHLKDGDVLVDIGANTGKLNELIQSKLKEQGKELDKVIMFEPVPRYYDECVKKFGDNPNYIINNLALSNDTETKIIYASHINYGYNKIYKEGMSVHPHDEIEIPCDTFSNWMFKKGIDKIDFVKIDAEGHDRQVIEGMFEWLRKTNQRPYIQFEGTWYPNEEKDLLETLKMEFGYQNELVKIDYLLTPH